MTEVKCLACRKMNFAGDRFCAACGSSLDLKLCASCEAINNPVADNCHSCGKPLPAAEAPVTPVFEMSEAPFYPLQRRERQREVYDAHPSLVMRLNRAAKVTTLVVLPLAAIGLWGWQFYGQKLLQTVSPWVKVPAAQVQTKVTPAAAAAVVGPLPVVTEAPKAKPAVAETKRPPKATQARTAAVAAPAVAQKPAATETAAAPAREVAVPPSPVPPTVRKGVTHTRAASAAATAAPTQAPVAPTQAPNTPEATAATASADSGVHVTHTKTAPIAVTDTPEATQAAGTSQAKAPAAPPSTPTSTSAAPAPLTGGSASCPQAAAVLGLCSPNTQKGGS